MRFDVTDLHNTTPAGADEDCPPVPEESLAIFVRAVGDPRLRRADTLTTVGTLTVEAEGSRAAAEEACVAGNTPGETAESRRYDAWGVRSLSVGDVVVVTTPDGAAAYECHICGWRTLDLRDYTVVAR
jgi:hypothetical protein